MRRHCLYITLGRPCARKSRRGAHRTGDSTLDRFLWVVSFLARNDFVVIPVDQLQFDDSLLVDRAAWGEARLRPSFLVVFHNFRPPAGASICTDHDTACQCARICDCQWHFPHLSSSAQEARYGKPLPLPETAGSYNHAALPRERWHGKNGVGSPSSCR